MLSLSYEALWVTERTYSVCARCICSMQSGNLAQSADCMPCSLQTARGPFQWEFLLTMVIIRFLACNWGKQ